MKRRIHLRGKRRLKISRKNLIIGIIIGIIVMIILGLQFLNAKASPVLFNYAEIESRKLATTIINNAVNKSMNENINVEDLFIITRDSNDEIKTIDFNPISVNQLLTKTTNNVQLNLQYVENGQIDMLDISQISLMDYDMEKLKQGIIYEIPSGVILGNSFLANIGPKIPVRFNLIGDIVSYINTKVTDYGINNALIEVNIVLELSEKVILPFAFQTIKIQTNIPVAMKLIQGTVPNYYLNGINQNSTSLALPIG